MSASLSPVSPSGQSTRPALFHIGEAMQGMAAPRAGDRVALTFIVISGPDIHMTMSTHEARAVANALYEAADASEKVLPVVAATVAA